MTIGYIISAYQHPAQLGRLVARLAGSGRTFHVHVDRRAPSDVHAEVARRLVGRADVTLLPSHACHWGDFGHVRATLKGLDALAVAGLPDYVVLLTGQDYPIKPGDELEARLQAHPGQSFMNHQPLPVADLPEDGVDRLDRWHFWSRGRHRVFRAQLSTRARRTVPCGLQPHFGSGYWCLHRQAVEYVLAFVRARPEYVRFFQHAFIPDEMFFQTLLASSPLCDTLVNDDLRFIRWPGPRTLTLDDWPDIEAAPDLFARKFDVDVDRAVLDRIDRDLLT